MRSLSSVGLGLSLVFGCLLLALIAELYYLLWWKKRINNRDIEEDYSNPTREFLYSSCFKKPHSLSSTALNPQELCSSVRITNAHVHEPQAQPQAQLFPSKDFWLKPFGDEDSVDDELLNLSGPPRFLFTINEETKEDLESEDAKSRTRSLSDTILTIETPFLTPLASPSCFTPPLTPKGSSFGHNGFSPLFKSATDEEFNRVSSSPPPKFKFLRDAEDKLQKRELMEKSEFGFTQDHGGRVTLNSTFLKDEQNGSFISLVVAKKKEKGTSSSSSQVLPLAASPPTFRQFSKQSILN
ncbi:hypothetical protein LguiA_034968 [Lonicera macranthoides]